MKGEKRGSWWPSRRLQFVAGVFVAVVLAVGYDALVPPYAQIRFPTDSDRPRWDSIEYCTSLIKNPTNPSYADSPGTYYIVRYSAVARVDPEQGREALFQSCHKPLQAMGWSRGGRDPGKWVEHEGKWETFIFRAANEDFPVVRLAISPIDTGSGECETILETWNVTRWRRFMLVWCRKI